MAESLSNKQLALFFLIALFAGIIFGSGALLYPFGRDQGIYAYAGKLLLEGKIDYRFVFDLKPPGVHFVFAFAQLLLGESMFGMRIFDIIWQSVTGFILFLTAYKFTLSKLAGVYSAVFYVFLYFRMDYWHTLQADGFLNLPFALTVLFLISRGKEKYIINIFISGILFGITILFKYTLILFLPLLFAGLLLETEFQFRKRIKKIIFFSSGVLSAILLTLLFYFFSGAIQQFIDIQFVQTPLYAKIGYETESAGFITANIIRLFLGSVYSPLIWLSLILAVYLLSLKKFTYKYIILYSWMVSSLAGLIIQWKFFYYHFLVIIPSLAAGASIFIMKLFERIKVKLPRLAPITLAVFTAGYIVFGFKPYIKNYTDLWRYIRSDASIQQLYIEKGITADSAFMIGNTFKAIEYIKNNTCENDGIFVWGFDPLIYYLSGRHCVSRFIYNFPLYWKENNEEFQNEFLNELNKDKPILILISQRDPLYFISGYKEDSKLMLNKFPGFKSFLDTNYNYKTLINDFYFYELNR